MFKSFYLFDKNDVERSIYVYLYEFRIIIKICSWIIEVLKMIYFIGLFLFFMRIVFLEES